MTKPPEPETGVGASAGGPGASASVLLALVLGQVGLHSTMSGIRMAAPLWVLQREHADWMVGVLMGLFATAPIVLALHAGRLADRLGYHRPIAMASGFSVSGAVCAVIATLLPAPLDFVLLCVAAFLAGAGANFGLIVIQRTAGRLAAGPVELRRVFSWLGLAPALSNMAGPVLAGILIDHAGFRVAFGMLALMPLIALANARRVPTEALAAPKTGTDGRPKRAWDLLRTPGIGRLFLVNWLLSASWDVHSFVIPVLGHERGFSASAIGLVLGVFAGAVTLVRFAIPMVAKHLREAQVLVSAMLCSGAVFAVYPLMRSAWEMGACSIVLGVALGSVQPIIMTALHQMTPEGRHGEAIALRSMTMNFSSAVMPLMFGVAGAALGAASLFWVMGAMVLAGSAVARRVGEPASPEPART